MSLRRRKYEDKEEEILAYGAKFSKINPSGNISYIKGIFLAPIMFMMHIPFKTTKTIKRLELKTKTIHIVEKSQNQRWDIKKNT